MQGRVDKIAKEMSLMDQQFIKDTSKTVAVSARAGCCCFRAAYTPWQSLIASTAPCHVMTRWQ